MRSELLSAMQVWANKGFVAQISRADVPLSSSCDYQTIPNQEPKDTGRHRAKTNCGFGETDKQREFDGIAWVVG
ncbi:hypothetical protein AGMMS50229_18680 [Campylobacterota bacterium]|nr:hypothetical protein AGMMS50229_18680 [Campylobacterota bacterium]